MSSQTTKLHTSDLPRDHASSSSSTTSSSSSSNSKPLPPHLHAALTTALLTANSIPQIEAVLTRELAASGWTTTLRAHIQTLVRSGECANYNELMRRVLASVT